MIVPGPLGRCLRGLGALFAERRCLACSRVFESGPDKDNPAGLFCPACRHALRRREKGFCPRCGEAAAWPNLPPAPCGRCFASPPPWQGFLCQGMHEGLLRTLLIRLKFKEEVPLAHALGLLLAAHPALSALSPDAVVPMPLHRARLVFRGFNQAMELARPLARRLGAPLQPGLLVRTRATAPQTGKDRKARMQGMKDAFAGSPAARGKRILLLDDTLTTGATMAEAARALLKAGAARVDVAVVSRAPRHFRP